MSKIFLLSVITICFQVIYSLPSNVLSNQERFAFFDAELLRVLIQDERENFVISPTSIKILLGMLLEGASGRTVEEIRTALRLPKDKERARQEFNTWLSMLMMVEPPNELKIASQVFVANRHPVKHEYKNLLKKHYNSGISQVNFHEPHNATKTINDWVNKQTSGLIPTLLEGDQIHSNTKMVLASAVYFKGVWTNPFSKERKSVKCFYVKRDECKKTNTMTEIGYYNYGYISRLNAQAIQLPYKGEKYFMLILLPTTSNGVDELSRDLVHVSFNSIVAEMTAQEVNVQLPQFEISYENDLVGTLKKLQVSNVFSKSDDITNIFETNSSSSTISHVFHSAKIKVNEEGSEAAAASGFAFVPLMGGPSTSFIANHPFLFFIMDSTINSVIFAGKFSSPSSSQPQEVFESSSPASLSMSLPPFLKSATGNSIVKSQPLVQSLWSTTPPLLSLMSSKPSKPSYSGAEVSSLAPSNLQIFNRPLHGSTQGPKFRSMKDNFPRNSHPAFGSSINGFDKLNLPLPQNTHHHHHHPNLKPDLYQKFVYDTKNPLGNLNMTSDNLRHHILLFN